ncbi:hypothetical protein OAF54_01780 [bacterium]|nr:hypothetical protein [bacterium]
MGFLGRIFGSDNAINKGFDLVDDAFMTRQEEGEERVKIQSNKIKLLEAYEAFKVAQRLIALIVCPIYVLLCALIVCLTLAGIDTNEAETKLNSLYLGESFLSIIIFYFGGGFVEGGIKKLKDWKK